MIACLALPVVSFAATFRVNGAADDHDALPGDRRCATAARACTLRAAIEEANSSGGADRIVFDLSADAAIVLLNGQLTIAAAGGTLSIDGPATGAVIVDGNHAGRVMLVEAGARASIHGLEIRNGFFDEVLDAFPEDGAGIKNLGSLALTNVLVSGNGTEGRGGGIVNGTSAVMTLLNTTVSANHSFYEGGGIDNHGTLALTRSLVSDNSTGDRSGGGIWSSGRLTLTESSVTGNTSEAYGGGIENEADGVLLVVAGRISGNSSFQDGGGIDSRGTLSMFQSLVENNSSDSDSGGIRNAGKMTIAQSAIIGNGAQDYGAGLHNIGEAALRGLTVEGNVSSVGGGIFNTGLLTLGGGAIRGNEGSGGGGGFENRGTATLTDVDISGNQDTDHGAGLANTGTMTVLRCAVRNNTSLDTAGGIVNTGEMTVTETTVSGNSGDGGIGGIGNFFQGRMVLIRSAVIDNGDRDEIGGIENFATLFLVNTTVSGNSSSFNAGGIENFGTLELWSSTVTNNVSQAADPQAMVGVGGIANRGQGRMTTTNSIVAGNRNASGLGTPDCMNEVPGSFISGGYNLFAQDTGCATGPHDVVREPASIATLLEALQDNGGPTRTHALLRSPMENPAIEGGDPAGCTDQNGDSLTSDQRGAPRPAPPEGRCDIGAYELQPSISFAGMSASLDIDDRVPAGHDRLYLRTRFTLGQDSDGISPPTERVDVGIGPFAIAIPAGSFRADGNGRFRFQDTLNGRSVQATIEPLGGSRFTLNLVMRDAELPTLANPVRINLTIGDDHGTVSVNAHFERSRFTTSSPEVDK